MKIEAKIISNTPFLATCLVQISDTASFVVIDKVTSEAIVTDSASGAAVYNIPRSEEDTFDNPEELEQMAASAVLGAFDKVALFLRQDVVALF